MEGVNIFWTILIRINILINILIFVLEKMSNLHRIVMDIKHQNQGVKLGQNHQIKFCSFQLMEGNPSISWQYFHRLEAFHLLAFGYNWHVQYRISLLGIILDTKGTLSCLINWLHPSASPLSEGVLVTQISSFQICHKLQFILISFMFLSMCVWLWG